MKRAIDTTDDQELGLQWQTVRDGMTVDDVLAQWVAAGGGAALVDLQTRLGALKGVPASVQDDVRRMLLGQPTAAVTALLAQVADLQAQLKAQPATPAPATAPA